MLQSADQLKLLEAHLIATLLSEAGSFELSEESQPFRRRLHEHLPALAGELAQVYGGRSDFLACLEAVVRTAWLAWSDRAAALRALDAQREANPRWFEANSALGAVCYADLYGGGLAGLREHIPYFKELGITVLHVMPPFKCPPGFNDGGYAVSSYREVEPSLGSIDDLRALAQDLREQGISLVLDFIFNHTSNEHEWAMKARDGIREFEDYYLIFPDRTMPDAYERTVREIFPDEHRGAFSRLPDGRWVWTTFHSYQWDLNYGNPAVFNAMAGEMLAIANLGTEVLRMDAVAFIWKALGTNCENLPQAHHLIRAFNAVARIAAPALLFKSEAIVHPDEVVKYIGRNECQLSYNPLQMALLWNSLATREVQLLDAALADRHALPEGTSWVNYVRCHDDIGWTFADEDAARFGIRGDDHRAFLNRYYVNQFPRSFARGVPFQHNPETGDCRVSGTCASLCGLEQGDPHAVARILLLHSVILSTGGLPLLYLGDEWGTLNDPSYLDDPAKAGDSRWVHRPRRDAQLAATRHDAATPAGQIFRGLCALLAARRSTAAFTGGSLTTFYTGSPHVLGYLRGRGPDRVLCLANFAPHEARCEAERFSAGPASSEDLLTGEHANLKDGLTLSPYACVWLRFPA